MRQYDFRSTPLLLIGRDPDMLSLLREVLLEAGFFVVARLSDGFLLNLEGSRDHPSLILYDEATPEIDAERVFYLLQDAEPPWCDIPFTILSDHFDGARVARCLDRGVAEFVTKPFDVDELAARVRKVLRGVIEEEANQQHEGPEGFAGDLAYMNLPDLLINLHQNIRTGELGVVMEEGEYCFWLRKGKLRRVTGPGQMSGRKALFRAIRQFYGKFVFTPIEGLELDEEREFGELPNLILQAVQEADEFPLSRNQLPPNPVCVELVNTKPEAASGDLRLLRPLLQDEQGQVTVDELIFAYHKTDLEAAQELLKLYQREVLVAVA